jgi:hypothetical protein
MIEAAHEIFRGEPEWFLARDDFATLEREASKRNGHKLKPEIPIKALFRAVLDFHSVIRRIYTRPPVPLPVVFYKSYQLRFHLDELADDLKKVGQTSSHVQPHCGKLKRC